MGGAEARGRAAGGERLEDSPPSRSGVEGPLYREDVMTPGPAPRKYAAELGPLARKATLAVAGRGGAGRLPGFRFNIPAITVYEEDKEDMT